MRSLIILFVLVGFQVSIAQPPPPPPGRTGKRLPPPPPPGAPAAQKVIVSPKAKVIEKNMAIKPILESVEEVRIEEPSQELASVEPEELSEEIGLVEDEKPTIVAEKPQETPVEVEKTKPVSVAKKFKGGMHKFKRKCAMHTEPSSSSPTAGSVRVGKKLWIDPHSSEWRKAYKKSGTVFVHRDCF